MVVLTLTGVHVMCRAQAPVQTWVSSQFDDASRKDKFLSLMGAKKLKLENYTPAPVRALFSHVLLMFALILLLVHYKYSFFKNLFDDYVLCAIFFQHLFHYNTFSLNNLI